MYPGGKQYTVKQQGIRAAKSFRTGTAQDDRKGIC